MADFDAANMVMVVASTRTPTGDIKDTIIFKYASVVLWALSKFLQSAVHIHRLAVPVYVLQISGRNIL